MDVNVRALAGIKQQDAVPCITCYVFFNNVYKMRNGVVKINNFDLIL